MYCIMLIFTCEKVGSLKAYEKKNLLCKTLFVDEKFYFMWLDKKMPINMLMKNLPMFDQKYFKHFLLQWKKFYNWITHNCFIQQIYIF